MKNVCHPNQCKRKSARYDYILHQNCKTYCKTQKIVSASCSVFMGVSAVCLRYVVRMTFDRATTDISFVACHYINPIFNALAIFSVVSSLMRLLPVTALYTV